MNNPTKEQIEAAAKAAGYTVDFDNSGLAWTPSYGHPLACQWHPWGSNQQAFELMADAEIAIAVVNKQNPSISAFRKGYGYYVERLHEHNNDKHAATRMAIFLAAAGRGNAR